MLSRAVDEGLRGDGEMDLSPEQRDFFVSYASKDREWAEWIAWVLEEDGHSTYIQAWDFRPGNNFAILMQQAAAAARRTLVVLSPGYLSSSYGLAEWGAAFTVDPSGNDRRVIPVRVAPCRPPGLMAAIVYIDVVGCSERDAERLLRQGIRLGRGKPQERPPFPGPIGIPGNEPSEG